MKTSSLLNVQTDLTAVTITLQTNDPLSTYALLHADGRVLVSANVPTSALNALDPAKVVCIEHHKFFELAAKALPAIGGAPQLPWVPLNITHWLHDLPNNIGVSEIFLQRGLYCIPEQAETWTCGVNSAARFASMLGQTIPNYQQFIDKAPAYKAGPFPVVGPNAERLQDYLREQPRLAGSDIGQRCTVDFRPQKAIIDKALSQARPALVLLVNSELSMHWVNIIGQRRATGNYILLNTDRRLYEISGGRVELEQQMNAGNCWAQKLGFISRFNTITCTNNCKNKELALTNFNADFYFAKHQDLQKAFGYLLPADRFVALSNHYLNHGQHEGRQAQPKRMLT